MKPLFQPLNRFLRVQAMKICKHIFESYTPIAKYYSKPPNNGLGCKNALYICIFWLKKTWVKYPLYSDSKFCVKLLKFRRKFTHFFVWAYYVTQVFESKYPGVLFAVLNGSIFRNFILKHLLYIRMWLRIYFNFYKYIFAWI